MLKLKSEGKEALNWMLPYPGDWHIMTNYSIALIKNYGPAGLYDLIALNHKGTANSVTSCNDFDKMQNFLFQVWEAMYRQQLDMFFKHKAEQNADSSSSHFDARKYLQSVYERMSMWSQKGESHLDYKESLRDVFTQAGPLRREFDGYVSNLAEQNETFRFWRSFV